MIVLAHHRYNNRSPDCSQHHHQQIPYHLDSNPAQLYSDPMCTVHSQSSGHTKKGGAVTHAPAKRDGDDDDVPWSRHIHYYHSLSTSGNDYEFLSIPGADRKPYVFEYVYAEFGRLFQFQR